MIPPLANIAADEFARRRATASRKVAAGELPANQANALVLPWLAIACRAGATLPELADDLADIAEGGVLTPAMARRVLADEICPLPRLRETLCNATAAAIRVHERARSEALPQSEPATGGSANQDAKGTAQSLARARGLMALARAFRAGPIPLSLPANHVDAAPAHEAGNQRSLL